MIDLITKLGGGGYAVSSLDLKGATERMVAPIIANSPENGGLGGLCNLAASQLNTSGESMIRRIFEMRSERSRSISAEIAEAYTMALGEYRLDDLDIPTLPRCTAAAVESVEAWVEITEQDESAIDAKRLARKLVRFASGYCHSFDDIEAYIEAEAWEVYAELFGPVEEQEQAAVAELVAA